MPEAGTRIALPSHQARMTESEEAGNDVSVVFNTIQVALSVR